MTSSKFRQDSKVMAGGALAMIVGCAVVLIVAIVIGAMFVFGFGWFSRETADFRGKTGQIERVNDPSYRMAQYDHFYDLCAGVQTDETRIATAKDQLKTVTDADRKLQLQANLDAAINQRAGDINQYNADARKKDTAAHFRASDLPYQINSNEEHTTCTAN